MIFHPPWPLQRSSSAFRVSIPVLHYQGPCLLCAVHTTLKTCVIRRSFLPAIVSQSASKTTQRGHCCCRFEFSWFVTAMRSFTGQIQHAQILLFCDGTPHLLLDSPHPAQLLLLVASWLPNASMRWPASVFACVGKRSIAIRAWGYGVHDVAMPQSSWTHLEADLSFFQETSGIQKELSLCIQSPASNGIWQPRR